MKSTQALLASAALFALAGCETPVDFDLRDLTSGFDTSKAVQNLPTRPRPDDRGVISYPNYQVVVARKDDTIRAIATRLDLGVDTVARFNGIDADVKLRRDELVALPTRVAEPSPATGAATSGPIIPQAVDVTAIATTAIDRAEPVTAAPTPTIAQPVLTGVEPVRHRVTRGETVYSIARLYNVPVTSLSQWNGLGPDLGVREGQMLLVPQSGQAAPVISPTAIQPAVETPGSGSETPVPPSASAPLPNETPSVPVPKADIPASPDLGAQTTAPAPTTNTSAQFAYPVQGSIIRAYSAGRNEGIDISSTSGTTVKAAASGTVAAVTTNTSGVAIVVIKHDGGLLTVYTNLDSLTVAKGAAVSKGQAIGKVRAGDPSFLHFEVRRGLQSVDPTDFLP